MTDPSAHTWISKRDGRLVPFDADEISRDLFAVTESLGRTDAFLARELTDGVLHFLAVEAEGSSLSSVQVAEIVGKVVRELGQPALAQAFLAGAHRNVPPAGQPPAMEISPAWREIESLIEAGASPPELARRLSRVCQHAYSLRTVFSRDLAAAHAEGLIVLGNLECPLELAGAVADISGTEPGETVAASIRRAREVVGDFVVFDNPEHALLRQAGEPATFADRLHTELDAAGLWAVVDLNPATAPAWAGTLADGPLFAEQQAVPTPDQLNAVAEALCDRLLTREATSAGSSDRIRIDWHLSALDFQSAGAERLLRLARRALDGAAIAFGFDRGKGPLMLAEGIDRQHPAVLMTVGLNLPRLAAAPAVKGNPVLFLQKLGSLARMALSAASQKREFLRRHADRRPALAQGFLVDRARLVVVPLGLEAIVRGLVGKELAEEGEGLDLARRIMETLRDVLRTDGTRRHLDACLDSPPAVRIGWGEPEGEAPMPHQQLQVATSLQTAEYRSTLAIRLSPEQKFTAEGAVELLTLAWRESNVGRLGFVLPRPSQGQLTPNWA